MLKILQARLQQYVNCELPDERVSDIVKCFFHIEICDFCALFYQYGILHQLILECYISLASWYKSYQISVYIISFMLLTSVYRKEYKVDLDGAN